MDTLAFGYMLPVIGAHWGLSPVRTCPCWAYKKSATVRNCGALWEQRESNPRPSACKADALNQLSYAPFNFGNANIYATEYALYLPDKNELQSRLKEWIEEFDQEERI